GCVRAVESDLGEPVLGDLHGGACLLHLLAQGLHLGDREASVLSHHNDRGVLEDTVERCDELFLSRSIHCKLFPVWRAPRRARDRRLRPAARPVANNRIGRRFDALPPEPRLRYRRFEPVAGLARRTCPKSVSTRLCRRLSRLKPKPRWAPAVSDRTPAFAGSRVTSKPCRKPFRLLEESARMRSKSRLAHHQEFEGRVKARRQIGP